MTPDEGRDRPPFRVLAALPGPAIFAILLGVSFLPDASLEGWPSREAIRTVAVLGWMVSWWLLEVVPLWWTSLLPLVLFPLLGVLSPVQAARPYGSEVIFLFLGGFLLAEAIEKTSLHRWIAIHVLSRVGPRPDRLLLGFMGVTGFISWWISNTAAALIMIPIARSIVKQESGSAPERDFSAALVLGVAYAASIGGVATIIGSPTNAILVAYLERTLAREVSFTKWMCWGVPLFLLGTALCWKYLCVFFRVPREARETDLGPLLRSDRALSADQKKVLRIFVLMLVAWIVGPLVKLPGLSDMSVALAGGALFLAVGLLKPRDLLRIRWGILILFGGGLALSDAIQASKLGAWISGSVGALGAQPPFLLLLAVTAMMILITEFTSNTSTVATFVPILAPLAGPLGIESAVLLTAVTFAASLSFMMPMATPPNAVAYSTGWIGMRTMAMAGAGLNIVFALLIALYCRFYVSLT